MRTIIKLLLVALFVVGCTPPVPHTQPPSSRDIATDLANGYLYLNVSVFYNETLKPPSGAVIEFGPNGQIVRDSNATGSAIEISAPNITINNMRVTASNPCFWVNSFPYTPPNPAAIGEMYSQYDPKRENQHGLAVRSGADNLKVNGLTVSDVWGDGVYVGGGNNIVLNNVNVRCAGRSGISNVNSSNVTVDGGSISGVFWWGLNIEPSGTSQSVSDYRVKNMRFGFSRDAWLFSGGPHFNCKVFRVDVTGNVLLPPAMHTPNVNSCADISW